MRIWVSPSRGVRGAGFDGSLRRRIIRLEAQGFAKLAASVGDLIARHIRGAQVEVGRGVIGLQTNGLAKLRNGQIGLAGQSVKAAEIVVSVGALRLVFC